MRLPIPHALAASAALALAATAATANAAPPADHGSERTGYIVVLKDKTAPGQVAKEHSNRHGAAVGHVYRHALRGYSANMSAKAAARIAEDDRVAFVQEDAILSIDRPGKGKGKPGGGDGGTGAAGQSLPFGIDRVDAEGKLSTNVGVAVLDTGVDLDHPDLNVYTAGAKNCAKGKSADDGNGHGTHVAGTIGAVDNGIGVVGVAPGATIWPVRVLNNNGSGTTSAIVCGIDYVTGMAGQIEVANMSLGGSGSASGTCATTKDTMRRAICNSVAAGVTYVVAAGNSSTDAANHVPAAYPEVITVSALADFDGKPGGLGSPTCRSDVDDTFANFSNYGSVVDIIAPGVCIESTYKGGGYSTLSGTSMASPHVAGAAALYKAKNPGASPSEVLQGLLANATPDWNNVDDKDTTKEPLLNVGGPQF